MKKYEPDRASLRKSADEVSFERLLAQLRQDQLEAARAGRMAEAAFFAAEAKALCEEFAQDNALCA